MLPSAKGLSIYVPVESSSSCKSTNKRAPLSFLCFSFNCYWVWMWLDLPCHELQCLVSPWSLKVLRVYVLRSQKELARYHLFKLLHDCFDWSVDVWKSLLFLASWLCHWYEFTMRPRCHCLCGLLMILLKFLIWVRHNWDNKIKQSS